MTTNSKSKIAAFQAHALASAFILPTGRDWIEQPLQQHLAIDGSPSPIEPGRASTQWTPLYSSIAIATATAMPTTIKLFGDINGSAGVTSDRTNMTKAFELESPQSFLVMAMRVVMIGCAAADLRSFMQNYTCRLNAAGKKILEAPAEYWAGGAGPSIDNNNGIADVRSVVSLTANPIDLRAGTTFNFEAVGTSFPTTGAFFMRVYLEGQYTRAIG